MAIVDVVGAWDATPFGNDEANDWAYELEGVDDLALIKSALAATTDADYLDSYEGSAAVAAVEVLTWLLGRPGELNAYTEKVAAWTQAHALEVSDALVDRAIGALDRVTGPDSELAELWEGQPEWLESVNALRDRLNPGQVDAG